MLLYNNCYLPDCNLVGTTFVNCLANTLSTHSSNLLVKLECKGVSKIESVGCDLGTSHLKVGSIQYGQSRDFIFRFPTPSHPFEIKASLICSGNSQDVSVKNHNAEGDVETYAEIARATYCRDVAQSLQDHIDGKGKPESLKEVIKFISSLPAASNEAVKALLKDLVDSPGGEARVTKALSTDERIKRWGAHYIRSLVCAHQVQQCHNFKDPSVQFYGGKMFKEIQAKADITFCSLPPPVPSRRLDETKRTSPAIPTNPSNPPTLAVTEVPSMEEYMNSGGGCFLGDGVVLLSNNSQKQVRELKKGDQILTEKGDIAEIDCLIRFPIFGKIQVCDINNLKITPRHPILLDDNWVYPKDFFQITSEHCDYLYNLILTKHHVISINGVQVATLGHQKSDNEVISHPYYGSSRIVDEMKSRSGYAEGLVEVKKVLKTRDPLTGRVISL